MKRRAQTGRVEAGASVTGPAAAAPAAGPSPVPNLTDEVTRARAGDEEAFRLLYRAVQPGLLRYVRGLVGEEAEDVASEAWAQIARDLGTFAGDGTAFRGWAATVARNRAFDHLRRVRRRPVTAGGELEQLTYLGSLDDTEGEALETLSTEEAIALIASLPPDQAEAVLLRVVMGLDAETAGSVLRKRAGAVRTASHRGLRRLALILEQRAAGPGVPTSHVDGEGGHA